MRVTSGLLAALAGVGALLLWPAMAAADLHVGFDYSAMKMVYTKGTESIVVNETLYSQAQFDVRLVPGPTIQDYTYSLAGAFDVQLVLSVTGGAGAYSVTGTYTAWDTNPLTPAIVAKFTSTAVTIDLGGKLTIDGVLATVPGNGSILVNRDPGDGSWVYAGQYFVGGAPDADETDGTITIRDPWNYDTGFLTELHFSTGFTGGTEGSRLDGFFGDDRTVEGGNVKGTIVPAPGAIVLGMVGLGLLGVWMRRYA